MIFEDALDRFEQVGAKRQSMLQTGLLTAQRGRQLRVSHAFSQRFHRSVTKYVLHHTYIATNQLRSPENAGSENDGRYLITWKNDTNSLQTSSANNDALRMSLAGRCQNNK